VEIEAAEKASAVKALQELHSQARSTDSSNRAGAKRSRTHSLEASLHDNVRELLLLPVGRIGMQIMPEATSGRKRLCCATEATQGLSQSNMHPAFNRPGMWEGILN